MVRPCTHAHRIKGAIYISYSEMFHSFSMFISLSSLLTTKKLCPLSSLLLSPMGDKGWSEVNSDVAVSRRGRRRRRNRHPNPLFFNFFGVLYSIPSPQPIFLPKIQIP